MQIGKIRTFHQSQFSAATCYPCNVHRESECLFSVIPFSPQFHHFQSEAFLHQSEFLVLAKQHRFAMFQINRILGAAFLIVYRFVCTVIEYHTILKNLANRSTLMVSGCLQHFHSAGTRPLPQQRAKNVRVHQSIIRPDGTDLPLFRKETTC